MLNSGKGHAGQLVSSVQVSESGLASCLLPVAGNQFLAYFDGSVGVH